MIKYPESSCLQQIFQIIKRRVPPSHKTDWVSIQQALRSPFQSIPTTSSFHIHKMHTSFSKAQKSNHSVKKKMPQSPWVFGATGSIPSLYFFAFSFFYPPPGSSPFLLSTLSYAISLPQASSHPPKISTHPCTFPHIPWQPASTQQLAMACLL